MNITVSVVGDIREAHPWIESQQRMWQEPATAWPCVDLDVDEDSTLGNILDAGASAVGLDEVPTSSGASSVSSVVAYVAFGQYADDTQPPNLTQIILVDGSGAAFRPVDWKSTSLASLLIAADRGLIDGDPRHIYLILPSGFGDFTGFDWDHVVAALWIAREAIGVMSDTSSIVDLARLAYARLRRRSDGVEAIAASAASWEARGCAPSDVIQMLSRVSRTAGEVSALLACSDDEAKAILWALGASHNDADGKWYWGRTSEDLLFATNTTTATYAHVPTDQLQEYFEWRVKAYLESGRVLDDQAMEDSYLATGQGEWVTVVGTVGWRLQRWRAS
jgi:hypothetical protein